MPGQQAGDRCLTDPQIQQELEKFISANHLKRNLSHEYFLLTPPHVEGCFTNQPPSYGGCSAGELPSNLAAYCAYHQNDSISPMFCYSNDPYVTGNGGLRRWEPSERPVGRGPRRRAEPRAQSSRSPTRSPTTRGQTAPGRIRPGVGDQCDGMMGTPLGTPQRRQYNQVIDGHFYWYQEEWSNQGHTCLQRFTLSGTAPTAKYTATAGSGLSMTFNATGSTAAGGIADSSWQFNDAFGASTIERTTPTIAHTFPAAGAYSTGLTVFGSDGLSAGAGGIVTTGHSGFTPGFTFSPAKPAAGQTVTLQGADHREPRPRCRLSVGVRRRHHVEGATPTHKYAKAGTYTVTAVLFSGVGSAYPGAGAAPVVTREITVS